MAKGFMYASDIRWYLFPVCYNFAVHYRSLFHTLISQFIMGHCYRQLLRSLWDIVTNSYFAVTLWVIVIDTYFAFTLWDIVTYSYFAITLWVIVIDSYFAVTLWVIIIDSYLAVTLWVIVTDSCLLLLLKRVNPSAGWDRLAQRVLQSLLLSRSLWDPSSRKIISN